MKAGDARRSRWSQTSEGARRCLGAPGVSVQLSAANLRAVNPVGWPGGADGGEFRIICPYAVGKWRICLWCSLIPVSVTVTNPTTLLMSCGCDANTQQPTRRGNEFMFITARHVISWQETGNRFVSLRHCVTAANQATWKILSPSDVFILLHLLPKYFLLTLQRATRQCSGLHWRFSVRVWHPSCVELPSGTPASAHIQRHER